MKCISCNFEINTNDEKCANCGYLIKDTIKSKSVLFDKAENKISSNSSTYSKEKKSSKTSKKDLIILMIILAVFIITNPAESDHENAVFKKIESQENFEVSESSLGNALGSFLGESILKNVIERRNFFLFSLTEVNINEETKIVGWGALGYVHIYGY